MPKLTIAARRTIRRALRRDELEPSEREGELNVVPLLDIVVNLMLFLLATTAATLAVAQVDTSLAGYCRSGCDERALGLELSVTLTEGGVALAGREGRVAEGCAAVGGGPALTIPSGPDGYDFAALDRCLAALDARFPSEDELILAADPSVPYAAVVRAMDAARGDGTRFPRVRLSAGVR